jgi:T-complex protein 1 subunit delta
MNHSKKEEVRTANIEEAKAVTEAIRTSLGPRGMDKMVVKSDGEVIITNDGATVLKKMNVNNPAAKIMVELAKSQDIAAGDGTTTAVVLCGSLLKKSLELLEKGVHPTINSDSFYKASQIANEFIEKSMAIRVDLKDRESLIKVASTSLNSKVVSCCSPLLSSIAVDCISQVSHESNPEGTYISNIKILKKLGGTLDDSEMIDGLVLDQNISYKMDGAPKKLEDAKICLAQFQISPPKSDIDSSVIISNYAQMDRLLIDERKYILHMVKSIKSTGCNLLLLQKSILRDSITELGEHYLAKAGILLVKDIQRDEVEFICKTLGCFPIAHIHHMSSDKLAHARLVEEVQIGSGKIVKITGIEKRGPTATVLLRGSNKLILEESARSMHDALCVVRCLASKCYIVPGGAACEIEIARYLTKISKNSKGMESYCIRAFAEALEIIPYTLAENAGLDPIQHVTELRARHAKGNKNDGINVRKGMITDMISENVIQPLMVTSSALDLASECARSILKIDGIFQTC